MAYTDFLKKPIEDYVKGVATLAAEQSGATRKAEIEQTAKAAAKSIIMPYALGAVGLACASLVLGFMSYRRSLKESR